MKLAEGLSNRKDLQMRIEQLKVRLLNNMKVQNSLKDLAIVRICKCASNNSRCAF